MGVEHCIYPWHWMTLTSEGSAHPCHHGSHSIGNICTSSVEAVWNGPLIQEVRASILAGKVHDVCRTSNCPHQQPNEAFSPPESKPFLESELVQSFDEDHYLENNPDVKSAVERLEFVSGLEHFAKFGKAEGRPYRLFLNSIKEEKVISQIKKLEFIGQELISFFDDTFYLENNRDVKVAAGGSGFASGLEHYLKIGHAEGRSYRFKSSNEAGESLQSINAMLALREYSRGATKLSSLPVDIVLQISSICNLHCLMCGHGLGTVENPRHMPVEVIDHAALYLSVAARMIFSGMGEPLLAPAFWKVIANYGREPKVFIRANSNAHFITTEKAKRILDSGLKEISFSLDAATPVTYHRIRGGEFEKALSGIRNMCAERRKQPRPSLEVFINMTLMCENIEEAPAFVELAYELQVDAIIFGQLLKFGDEPTWIARRDSFVFKYSEQMLRNAPDKAHKYLTEAAVLANKLGVKLIFLQNTDLYFAPVGTSG